MFGSERGGPGLSADALATDGPISTLRGHSGIAGPAGWGISNVPNPKDELAPAPPRKKRRSRTTRKYEECWRCRKEIDLLLDGLYESNRWFHWTCYLKHHG